MPADFLPAAHYHFLTPAYEVLARPFSGRIWRRVAAEVVWRAPRQASVLDIGCGPGTVLRMIRREREDLTLIGTDIDQRMIAIAKSKAKDRNIIFARAGMHELAFAPASMNMVMSTLVFHHLDLESKRRTLREVRRLLRPGGVFLLTDFSLPIGMSSGMVVRLFQHCEPEAREQLEDGQLLRLSEEAGARVETRWTVYGSISLHVLTFPLAGSFRGDSSSSSPVR